MLSLHDVTEDTKVFVKWGFLGLVVIVIFGMIFSFLQGYFKIKPKPNLAAMSFGPLPPIPFPQSVVQKPASFDLETLDKHVSIIDPTTSQPEVVPDKILVYQLFQSQADLNSLETAKTKVAAVGFVKADGITPLDEQRVSDTVYKWDKTAGLAQTILMNISTFSFHLISAFSTYPAVVNTINGPSDITAPTTAQNFLAQMKLLPNDIDQNTMTTVDYKLVGGSLVPANPGEQVQAVRVNFFQKAVNNLPFVYPNDTQSTMSFLVTGGDNNSEIADATYAHQNVDLTPGGNSTYPLKSPDLAYADLQAGNGYIVPSYTGGPAVVVKTVNLGYYIGETQQQYLMPVYIFKGDNNFTAYVSAVAQSAISASPTTTPGQ